jgi:hypothetical protein
MRNYEQAETWLAEVTDLMRAAGNTMYLTYALRYRRFVLLQHGEVSKALATSSPHWNSLHAHKSSVGPSIKD